MSSMTFMTYLAQQTEVELHDNLDTIRRCFDGLLAEFPLSYGHWKRYADHEVRHGNLERATEVYERGVKAAAYCVELWSFYAAHAVTHWSAQPDKVRAVFERAVDQVGSDYLADKLWDRYIAFETPRADASATPDHSAVGALFARVLRRPLKALDSYWTRLGQLASTWSSNELLDGAAEAALQAELEARGAAPQPQPGAEGHDEGARKLRVLPLLEARYKLTRSEHAVRLALEAPLRRRHFHIKPLPAEELQRWGAYLDWAEARGRSGTALEMEVEAGSAEAVEAEEAEAVEAEEAEAVAIFERCLVPCCREAEVGLPG